MAAEVAEAAESHILAMKVSVLSPMNTDMSVFIVHMSVFTCHLGISLAYLGGMNTDMETMKT